MGDLLWIEGGTYLGQGVPTLDGVPTLAWQYLPWLGGTYLDRGGGYLPWTEERGTYLGLGGGGRRYLPWTGYAAVGTPLAASCRRTF